MEIYMLCGRMDITTSASTEKTAAVLEGVKATIKLDNSIPSTILVFIVFRCFFIFNHHY